MALSSFQRDVCLLLAAHRNLQSGSYVAGGVALNEALAGQRISRDIDLFHDTLEALEATWQADSELLLSQEYAVEILRERPGFVEAIIRKEGGSVEM